MTADDLSAAGWRAARESRFRSMSERTPEQRREDSPARHIAGLTDVGLVRRRNEDDFSVDADVGLLIVADGLGGLPGGDLASRVAVEALRGRLGQPLSEDGHPYLQYNSARDELISAIFEAHEAVVARGEADPASEGMATTIVVARVVGGAAFISHVGDVRAYKFSAGRLIQITNDHSLVGEMVAAGKLTPEQARLHPRKNIVTQALGIDDQPMPSFTSVDLLPGDLLLLCSDGLWESMPGAQLERIVSAASSADAPDAVAQCVETLADVAIEAGGNDNITLVIYRHGS